MADWLVFILLSLAAFRVTRFVIKDFLFADFRDWVWAKFPPDSTKTGYFLTCPWCIGFWVSLALFFCYTILPSLTLWCCVVLALSTIVGWLTAFDDRF